MPRTANFHSVVMTSLAAVAFFAACLLPPAGRTETAPVKPKGCQEPVHRQFDFWIGHWDVFLPDGSKAGENRIESILGGCALQEFWSGRGGLSGSSLNSFDSTDRKWHQIWIDNSGGRLDLAGTFEGNAMSMSSTAPHPEKPGTTITHKITWTPNSDGSLRQLWQTSDDGGKTWSTAFDGRYARKKP
jgi:hypothetical protein